jgi:hypothetical protein
MEFSKLEAFIYRPDTAVLSGSVPATKAAVRTLAWRMKADVICPGYGNRRGLFHCVHAMSVSLDIENLIVRIF